MTTVWWCLRAADTNVWLHMKNPLHALSLSIHQTLLKDGNVWKGLQLLTKHVVVLFICSLHVPSEEAGVLLLHAGSTHWMATSKIVFISQFKIAHKGSSAVVNCSRQCLLFLNRFEWSPVNTTDQLFDHLGLRTAPPQLRTVILAHPQTSDQTKRQFFRLKDFRSTLSIIKWGCHNIKPGVIIAHLPDVFKKRPYIVVWGKRNNYSWPRDRLTSTQGNKNVLKQRQKAKVQNDIVTAYKLPEACPRVKYRTWFGFAFSICIHSFSVLHVPVLFLDSPLISSKQVLSP